MPIEIRKVHTRAKRIDVDVEPAEWREYIAH